MAGKKEKEIEIYDELLKKLNLFEFYLNAEKEGDWENPDVRISLPRFFGENPERYALMPERGFRAEMKDKFIRESERANQLLYNNFYDLLKKHKPEEIATIILNIPFLINIEEIKDEKLKKIAEHHATISALKKMDVKTYRNLLLKTEVEEGIYSKYAKLTLPDEGLEIEKRFALIEQQNYLISELKKLKEKTKRENIN
ncbi:MAG: hypothetical protein QW622_00565 [Candidatus Pacearchaeota archaeon]